MDLAPILAELRAAASPRYLADMSARYEIVTRFEAWGVPVAALKKIAEPFGHDQALAEALWDTGVHDARMLASLVGEPGQVTRMVMDRWAEGFDNWGIVDTLCFNLFDRSPDAFDQIDRWAASEDEFVKRAAFALLASCALHKQGTDADLARGLELIEREAGDPRNFAKKGVVWALRGIGQGRASMRGAARATAARLAVSPDRTRAWIGREASKGLAKAG